ncbi:MAG: CCA tRNA nucleotidyltransferase, partial [Pseudomonadota bacterium]
ITSLGAAKIRAIPTGIEHGTVTAVRDRRGIEITTLRRDVETDGRHATVSFDADWREDAERRDFTMNALFADPDGTIHDFVGGLADARASRVRFVGDPEKRIEEDYLRILRFFRFQALVGKVEPDRAVLAVIRRNIAGLDGLSGERITRETLGLLGAKDPASAWALLCEIGIDKSILGDAVADPSVLTTLIGIERTVGVDPDGLRRLSALGRVGRLRLSGGQTARLGEIRAARESLTESGTVPGPIASRIALYRWGREVALDGFLTSWASRPDWPEGDAKKAFAIIKAEPVPQFDVTGQDVLDLGVQQGAAVGDALRKVEGWWIENGLTAGREACLAHLRKVIPL